MSVPESGADLGSSPAPVSDARPLAVITGGHAAAAWAKRAWLEPAGPGLPPIADRLDPELVLRGLGLLAEHLAQRPGAGATP
jgi:hypothetical protein